MCPRALLSRLRTLLLVVLQFCDLSLQDVLADQILKEVNETVLQEVLESRSAYHQQPGFLKL